MMREQERVKELERENREFRRANEILRKAWHQFRREDVALARCTVIPPDL